MDAPAITLNEAVLARYRLEADIFKSIEEFQKKTGLHVQGIFLEMSDKEALGVSGSGRYATKVSAVVRL